MEEDSVDKICSAIKEGLDNLGFLIAIGLIAAGFFIGPCGAILHK